jgi:ribosomal protein L37AE/L43A
MSSESPVCACCEAPASRQSPQTGYWYCDECFEAIVADLEADNEEDDEDER